CTHQGMCPGCLSYYVRTRQSCDYLLVCLKCLQASLPLQQPAQGAVEWLILLFRPLVCPPWKMLGFMKEKRLHLCDVILGERVPIIVLFSHFCLGTISLYFCHE